MNTDLKLACLPYSDLCSELKGRAGCEIIDTNLGYLERNTLIIENADL